MRQDLIPKPTLRKLPFDIRYKWACVMLWRLYEKGMISIAHKRRRRHMRRA